MALFSSGKAILPLTLDVPPLAGSTSVVPAGTAGTQADTDVSGRILRAWMPAIHAGMTKPTVCLETESLFFIPLGQAHDCVTSWRVLSRYLMF
jgi:hypothetical protein